jgi:hypothetical protein
MTRWETVLNPAVSTQTYTSPAPFVIRVVFSGSFIPESLLTIHAKTCPQVLVPRQKALLLEQLQAVYSV